MNILAEAKLYANAAYLRNKEIICDCHSCREKKAEEKLEQVQRIIASGFAAKPKGNVKQFKRAK